VSVEIHQRCLSIATAISPVLTEAIATIGSLELTPCLDTPFSERLCRAVAGQQLSIKAAASIWKRVLVSAGEISLIDHVAIAPAETLRACGLSAAKAKTMKAIAHATLDGQLEVDELRTMDQGDRAHRLTAIWGVGQWTADMMGIFYFGDPDIWPEGDVTARKTLTKLTSARRKTTRTASHFAPYRSYLALYMWRHVDASPD
jgi:DNA-3-methyladenine glycosylase II